MKSVQIRSFFWSVFSCIQTEYGDLRSNDTLLALIAPALNGVFFRDMALMGRRNMFVYESLTVNIWKITPTRAGVEEVGVILGPV